ncbi:sensor histidine kinase [Candidatus Avoscillospira sp. LCP25S3_F1]|uniref:sensor histidine kinase n=1 Tax=Candidatus Avoscillospira sp. LCP25S3_F1 TaxID=3438825 RepID=UPI003F91D5BA
MNLLRNLEICRFLAFHLVLMVLAAVAAFVWNPAFGWFTVVLCVLFSALHLLSTRSRYRRIAALSADLDRVLHGQDGVDLDRYEEGELAILQSEIRKMIIRLREQQQNLQQDKVYLADSIADISHQLRTPLTTINLLVSFLSEPDCSTERRLKLARELCGLLSRIDWLITALLKLSKLDAGTVRFRRETLPMAKLLHQAAEPLLVPMELRDQTVTVKADGTFEGDIAWTQEALANVLKNCMEHTPSGGVISVTATETALYREIRIADTGCGIDPVDLPHIFERFYKGKDADDKSFGIGLALARRIITNQNGTIKAENRPEGGALFTIRFYQGTV